MSFGRQESDFFYPSPQVDTNLSEEARLRATKQREHIEGSQIAGSRYIDPRQTHERKRRECEDFAVKQISPTEESRQPQGDPDIKEHDKVEKESDGEGPTEILHH